MMGSSEMLPDDWIRKESRSRPNQFYYFNTKTGKSQWIPPNNVQNSDKQKCDHQSAKSTKVNTNSSESCTKSSKVHDRFKTIDKSKRVKKTKSCTPAQDRLDKLVKKDRMAVAKSINALLNSKNSDSQKCDKRRTQFVDIKKPQTSSKHTNSTAESAKAVQFVHQTPINTYQSSSVGNFNNPSSDEIPVLFPPKNPAQKRLQSLQQNMTANHTHIENDKTLVFSDCFGMESVERTFTGEEMDWEPMDDTNYSFQQLERMAVDELTESSYIIPDTNVFLDSLASIRRIIEKDFPHSILIPFVVLQELDQLKQRKTDELLSSKASRAIKYIYEQLKAKNPRLNGQKATDDKVHLIDVTSPDDKILNCCIQLKKQLKDIILVTNDINLSSKAILSDIDAITSKQCLERF